MSGFGGSDKPEFPAPFLNTSTTSEEEVKTVKQEEEEEEINPYFSPQLVDSPYFVKHTKTPSGDEQQQRAERPFFPVGEGDLGPTGEIFGRTDQGGMIVGPDHPGFWNPRPAPRDPLGSMGVLPRGAVPPGARFDPITPLAPGSGGLGSAPGWPSGEPDPDAEPMSGAQVDPLHPGWKPPRGNGGVPPSPGSGTGKIGGAPFFF